jgi:hypothetical protein
MPKFSSHLPALLVIVALAASSWGCNSLYALPDPPVAGEWTQTSLVPGQDDRDDATRYIAARTAALKLYQALNDEDWDAAWELMSAETQNFLNYVAVDGNGKNALAVGRLKFPGGEEVDFEPVALFLVVNMRKLDDDAPGQSQAETANRKEIFAFSTDDEEAKKVVLIFEGGAWRIHRTKAF